MNTPSNALVQGNMSGSGRICTQCSASDTNIAPCAMLAVISYVEGESR